MALADDIRRRIGDVIGLVPEEMWGELSASEQRTQQMARRDVDEIMAIVEPHLREA